MTQTQALPRGVPEDVGIASGTITSLLEALAARGQEMHSLMLVRHGKVAAECWWKPYAPELPHALYSLSKSFTSTAVGLLVDERKLDVDRAVLDLLAEEAPARPSRYLKAMKVRHLLTMSTGHSADPMESHEKSGGRNWAKTILRARLEHEPGSTFVYNSSATYLLSAIVQKVSGQRLLEYLTPRLFEPLGITGATWERCPRGIDVGGWGLSIRTEDIAKLGLLYLRRGEWGGRRLLSPTWVDEATRAQISTSQRQGDWAQGYGYQFWRCRHGAYRGDGAFGQYCIVLPEQDAVLAITSAASDMQAVLDAVWDTLLPGLRPVGESVKVVKKHQNALRRTCATRRLEPPAFQDHPNTARLDGSVYAMEENPARLKTVSLGLPKGRLQLKLRGRRSATYRCGAGRWASGKARPMEGRDRTPHPIRSAYTWTPDGALEAWVRRITTPHMEIYTIRFTPDGIELGMRMNVSFRPPPAPIKGRKTAG